MPAKSSPDGHTLVFRIPWLVRLTHWLIALALFILLLSGLQIFNAHPALYWGSASRFDHPFLSIGATKNSQNQAHGFLRIGSWQVNTTGILGLAKDSSGQVTARAFPHWLTLPGYQSLADGRRWHFFFAWWLTLGLAFYYLANAIRGRFRRDLFPTGRDLRGLSGSILDHLKFRFPHGEEARHYNVLQKLSYLVIMFGVIPLVILTGLALSPSIDAAAPWLLIGFGGRQSARSVHFLGTITLVLFFFVHILMVVAASPINEMRSMITGWFTIRNPPNAELSKKD